MPSILFVCTANRFRSPIAAAIFKNRLREIGCTGNWRVDSAGTWTDDGLPPMREAVVEMQRRNLDLRGHTSRKITDKNIRNYDMVLVMESGHKEALQSEFPEMSARVSLLTELNNGVSYSIPDPYTTGESPAFIASEIESLILRNFDFICKHLDIHEAN